MQRVIDIQGRKLREHGTDEQALSAQEYADMNRLFSGAKFQLERFLAESEYEKDERYTELHEAMVDMHDRGFAELDFGRTGL